MAKILILSTVHGRKDTRIFFKEILSLKKKYDDIAFVVPDNNKIPFFDSRIKIIPLPLARNKKERLLDNQRRVWKIIKEENPDVVHFHDPELIFLGFLEKKILRKKVIFDIHENVSASFKDNLWLPQFIKPIIPFLYRAFEKVLIKDFDALIIAEKSYRKTYGKKPVEILNYPILPKDLIVEKNFTEPFNIVYVGGIWERRGAFKMLNLIKRLIGSGVDVRLFLAGPFVPAELEQQALEYINENKLTGKVEILGKLTLNEVYSLLQKAHLGLSLMQDIGNYKESLSTKIFEYMAHSIPYIVSDFPIYKEYTLREETGITVNYENDDEIFNKTFQLLSSPNKMKELGQNGQNAVREKWNWEAEEKKLFKIYDGFFEGNQ